VQYDTKNEIFKTLERKNTDLNILQTRQAKKIEQLESEIEESKKK